MQPRVRGSLDTLKSSPEGLLLSERPNPPEASTSCKMSQGAIRQAVKTLSFGGHFRVKPHHFWCLWHFGLPAFLWSLGISLSDSMSLELSVFVTQHHRFDARLYCQLSMSPYPPHYCCRRLSTYVTNRRKYPLRLSLSIKEPFSCLHWGDMGLCFYALEPLGWVCPSRHTSYCPMTLCSVNGTNLFHNYTHFVHICTDTNFSWVCTPYLPTQNISLHLHSSGMYVQGT